MVLHFSRSTIFNVMTMIALLLAAVPARAQSGAPEVVFRVQVPPAHIQTTPAGYDHLTLAGYSDGAEPGQPILPYRIFSLALPPEADPETLQVELLDVERQTLPGAYRLETARPPQIKSQPLAPGAGMAQQATQPAAAGAGLLPAGQLRRWQFARVRFAPASYDPNSGAVTLITHATLRLSYRARVSDQAAGQPTDGVMDAEAAALLENFDQAQGWYPEPGQVSPAAAADYVIITTEALKNGSASLDDFVAFKQGQGYAVQVVTESGYGMLTGPAPDGRAEKIRAWLQANYVEMGIRYVLLIGNPDPDDPASATDSVGDLPMKMCHPFIDRNTPTDYYYADLTGNWNRDGDSRYCEFSGDMVNGGIDMAAEVYVGRIPVYGGNASSLDSILQKTITYEGDPDPDAWRKTALLPMSFVDVNTDEAHFGEQMKSNYLTAGGFSSWTMYQQGGGACGANSTFASSEELRGGNGVRNRWNATDFGLVTWSGHGSETSVGIGYENCWDGDLINSTLAAALDPDRPSIVYASSCNNGYPENSNNLGTALLRTGAVATLSASRVSWYVPGDADFENDPSVSGLGYEFNRRLAVYNDPVGKALFDAKNATPANYDYWLMNKLDMNLYGDPTVTLLSAPPPSNPVPTLDGITPDQAHNGAQGFPLTLTGSNFIENSLARWNGQNLPTIYVSPTQLTAVVDAARIAAPGSFEVTVYNPQPVGGTSAARVFLVYGDEDPCAPAAGLLLDQPDTGRNDAPGSTDQIDTYPGVGWDETGPEYAYSFIAPVAGRYTARLSATSADLDVFVLDGASGSCKTSSLAAYGDSEASFEAAKDRSFYILVDGYAGNAGEYTLTLTCPTCPKAAVVTGLSPASAAAGSPDLSLSVTGVHFLPGSRVMWDDRALVTIYHSSTSLSAALPAALLAGPLSAAVSVANPDLPPSNPLAFAVQPDLTGVCAPMLSFTGPARDMRRSDSPGATNRIAVYPASTRAATGPEFAYSYTAPNDRAVSVRLTGLKTDLDLAIIADDGAGNCRAENALTLAGSEAAFQALAGQTYYFVVDGIDGATGAYTLTVDDDVVSPADGTRLLNNRTVFNWEDDPLATAYLLQVSSSSNFRSLYWSKTVTRSIFFPSNDLVKNRTLYWRVIPRYGAHRGPISATRVLFTANPPTMPTLLLPHSGVLQRDLTPRFDWLSSTPAADSFFGRYQIQVAREPSFLAPVVDHDLTGQTDSEYTLPVPLAANTRYYWRVRAFDAGGQHTNWTPTRTMRTPLSAPLLSLPVDDAPVDTLRPRFEWASPDAASGYTLQVATTATFRSLAVNKTTAATFYQPGSNLRSGRIYYWRARANGPNGPSAWSQMGWFYTP